MTHKEMALQTLQAIREGDRRGHLVVLMLSRFSGVSEAYVLAKLKAYAKG